MFWQNFFQLQSDFINQTFKRFQLDSHRVTAIPSLMFLTFSFMLCHRVFHRRTCYHTPLKLFLEREVGFQWTYFYIFRIWLSFIKNCRLVIDFLEQYLQAMHKDTQFLWLNPVQLRAACFTTVASISAIPLTVLILNYLWKQNIPNFLMWVGEDPWLRSEIGTSGHYLNRPVQFRPPQRKEYSYRSKRSSSVDCVGNPTITSIVRKYLFYEYSANLAAKTVEMGLSLADANRLMII